MRSWGETMGRSRLTNNDILVPLSQPLPHELGPLARVFGVEDTLLAGILGREAGKVEVGEDPALGILEVLKRVERGIAWDTTTSSQIAPP